MCKLSLQLTEHVSDFRGYFSHFVLAKLICNYLAWVIINWLTLTPKGYNSSEEAKYI